MAWLTVEFVEWSPPGLCSVVTAIVGSAVVGGVVNTIASGNAADAAESAAQTQADAANRASDRTQANFNQIRADLQPYREAGPGALTQLQTLTGTQPGGNPLTAALTKPFAPTMESLAATPGYQFVRQEGLKAVQNAYSAQGLAASGPALKGATQFAENLAGSTFQQQFTNYLNQNRQINDILQGQVTIGQNAAAQTGAFSTQANAQINSNTLAAGNAQAAGTVAATNALNSGLTSIGTNANNTALLYALNQGGMFGKPNNPTSPQSQTENPLAVDFSFGYT